MGLLEELVNAVIAIALVYTVFNLLKKVKNRR